MEKQLYSIHVIVFHPVLGFGFNYEPGVETADKIKNAMIHAMHGIVGPSQSKEDFCGHMYDIYGTSEIINFKISDTVLSFTKQYKGRPPIDYIFMIKDEDIWAGEWKSENGTTGDSKCVVIPVNESFLEPD